MALIQFEDLPSTNTPLSAANLNNNFNELIAGEQYSTTEIKTNKTWYDGKPVYKKVVAFTPTTQDYDFGGIGESNVDRIISANGLAYRPSSGYYNLLPCNYSGWEIYLYDLTGTYGMIKFSANQWGAGVGLCVIVFEYTKTTD